MLLKCHGNAITLHPQSHSDMFYLDGWVMCIRGKVAILSCASGKDGNVWQ